MGEKKLLEAITTIAEELKRKHLGKTEKMLEEDEECEVMFKLSDEIIDVILNNNLIKNDMRGWASIIMLALGRATAIVLSGLNSVHATGFIPADVMYEKFILPTSLAILQAHVDEKEKAEAREEDNGAEGS